MISGLENVGGPIIPVLLAIFFIWIGAQFDWKHIFSKWF